MEIFKLWLTIIVILYVSEATVNGNEEMYSTIKSLSPQVVDKILKVYKQDIIDSEKFDGVTHHIDDIQLDLPINDLNVYARILATNGRLTNLGTARRIGPVNVVRDNSKGVILINSTIRFDDLKVIFDHFVVDLSSMSDQTGTIEVRISDCLVQVTIEVEPGEPCTARLVDFNIVDFHNFVPAVHRLRWKVPATVADTVLMEFIKKINYLGKAAFKTYFYDNIKDAVNEADVCGLVREWMPVLG